MNAQYQVHEKGMAYRYTPHRSTSTTVYPSITFIEQSIVQLIWYISNTVHASDEDRDGFIIGYTHLTLSHTCTNNDSVINIYNGLQPPYWIKWRAQAHANIECNMTNVNITLHSISSTLVLTRSLSGHVSFSFRFMSVCKHLSHCSNTNADKCVAFRTTRSFQYISAFSPSPHTVRISSFQYQGATPTTRSAIVAISASDLTTHRTNNRGMWRRMHFTEGISMLIIRG